MSVVNVKVKYIRPLGYQNLKKWMEDSKNVYIGRRGIIFIDKQRFPQTESIFANPFKVDKDGTRAEVILKYEKYIRERIEKQSSTRMALLELKGKILGCWCKPEACHGDILLKLIDEYDSF